jgi:hypothetical protein
MFMNGFTFHPMSRRISLAALAACAASTPFGVRSAPSDVVLTIDGKGAKRTAGASTAIDRAEFTLADLAAMPQHSVTTKAPWHDGERTYSGPLLRDVFTAASARAGNARYVALNDYRVDIPGADIDSYPVVLAIRLDGKPMSVRDKGPLFVMYPFDKHPELRKTLYYSRCIWQLQRIELS